MEEEPFSSQFSVCNKPNEIIYKQRHDSAQIESKHKNWGERERKRKTES